MKKVPFILALILALTLTACSADADDTSHTTHETEQSAPVSEENAETTTAPSKDTEDETAFDEFAPAENIEFDSVEDYEQYLSRCDSVDDETLFTEEELEAFISENYDEARGIADFCRSLGADLLNIGVDFDNTVVITGDNGFEYQCAPTNLSSTEEFWEYAAEYFSAATVEQLKDVSADYLLYEANGVLYAAIGAKGSPYYYDPDTIEIVRQTEDRATISIVKSYMFDGEKIALRDLVKEDGQWKFDFIM